MRRRKKKSYKKNKKEKKRNFFPVYMSFHQFCAVFKFKLLSILGSWAKSKLKPLKLNSRRYTDLSSLIGNTQCWNSKIFQQLRIYVKLILVILKKEKIATSSNCGLQNIYSQISQLSCSSLYYLPSLCPSAKDTR